MDKAKSQEGTKNRNGIRWKEACYAASPALLYTLFSNVLYLLLHPLASGLGASGLAMQAMTSIAGLAVFGWWALKIERILLRSPGRGFYCYPAAFCYVSGVVVWGIACNQMIYLSRLRQASPGYRHVTDVFYGNSLLFEVLTLCVIAPVLEEIVYRGLVYRRFCEKGSKAAAAVWSALIFGLLHFNLVQCLYAFAAGLLLAYIVGKTGSLVTAMAAHGTMNLVSVLWTETSWLSFLNQEGARLYLLIAACAFLTVVFFVDGNRWMKKME